MAQKPSIPKGTRDFGPEQSARRTYIFNQLKAIFERFGYQPIETPAVEKLSTLTGKYGEEGDRLIWKILNSGDYLAPAKNDGRDLNEVTSNQLTSSISEKALRYDLTIPFARFVVQHQNEISFPFKRFQIQPVWRGDRPAKGRYREFYQCDIDVVGSNSLLNEIELINIVNEGFTGLGLPDVAIKINNRKVLAGVAEVLGVPEKFVDITVALDKLDKIGAEKVKEELIGRGLTEETVAQLDPILNMASSNEKVVKTLTAFLGDSEIGQKGIEEVTFLLETSKALGVDNIVFDCTLARGLNYYTGAIFEVTHPKFNSSICGGGRYDDLTGIFGLPNVSGVGISFGADRIYDLLEEQQLWPASLRTATNLLFVNFGDQEAQHCLQLLKQMHRAGVSAELYPDTVKMGKQMKYADAKGIRFVALVGSKEIEAESVSLKDMESGEQQLVKVVDLAALIKEQLT